MVASLDEDCLLRKFSTNEPVLESRRGRGEGWLNAEFGLLKKLLF